MPGKHLLIETEDGGDDSKGVTETKSKILDFHSFHSTILCRLNGKQEFEVEAALFSREEFHSSMLFSLLR